MKRKIIKGPKKKDNIKNKKVKLILKLASLGLAATMVGKSAFAQLEYKSALKNAEKSGKPYEISMLKGDEKKQQLNEYFYEAIDNNSHLKSEEKTLLKESFSEIVIDKWYELFDENTISNLYAVSNTERFRNTTKFELDIGWWDGDFNPLFNSMQVVPEDKGIVASHEQLHASTRGGLTTVGFSNPRGYGINEGATSFINGDFSYKDLSKYTARIGHIIGYKNLFTLYLNHDLKGIEEQLGKYIDKSKVNELINEMDKFVGLEYFEEFAIKNIKSQKLNDGIDKDFDACKNKIEELLADAQKSKNENSEEITFENVLEDYHILGEQFYHSCYDNDIKKYFRLMEHKLQKDKLDYLAEHKDTDIIFAELNFKHSEELKDCFQTLLNASENKNENFEQIRENTAKIFVNYNRFSLDELIKNHLSYNIGSVFGDYYESYMVKIENALSINNLATIKEEENYEELINNFCQYMNPQEKIELVDLLEKNFTLVYFGVELDENEQARLSDLMEHISKQKYDSKKMLEDFSKNPDLFEKVYGDSVLKNFKDLEWILLEDDNKTDLKTGFEDRMNSIFNEEEKNSFIEKMEMCACGEKELVELQTKIYELCEKKNENTYIENDGKNICKLLVTKSMIDPLFSECYNKNNVFEYVEKIEQIIGADRINEFYKYKISSLLEMEIKKYLTDEEYNELNSDIVGIMNGDIEKEDRTDELIIKMSHNSGKLELENIFREEKNSKSKNNKEKKTYTLEEISNATKRARLNSIGNKSIENIEEER